MKMVTKKPKGLGRGLEALLGPKVAQATSPEAQDNQGLPSQLPLTSMVAGMYQPRTRMDEGALYELAESIKAQGIMQPILVRQLSEGPNAGKYEIIAGERRFRASHIAGLTHVPVLVRDVPNEAAAAMALIENIQREDLNPLEEAQGLQRLIKEFGLTHEQAAQAVGRSRSAASNLLRLLMLAEPVQSMLMAATSTWVMPARCCRWTRPRKSRQHSKWPPKKCRCAKPKAWLKSSGPNSAWRRKN